MSVFKRFRPSFDVAYDFPLHESMSQTSEVAESMTVAVFGATGVTGLLVLRALLSRGHTVRALTRSPNKIPADLAQSDSLTVVVGELTDEEKLREVLLGANAVVNMLGRKFFAMSDFLAHMLTFVVLAYAGKHPGGLPITKGMETVVDFMEELSITR
jgi:NAD(P)-dependent dehydrogenase (short-subunit alcohol dehydrogenase family)